MEPLCLTHLGILHEHPRRPPLTYNLSTALRVPKRQDAREESTMRQMFSQPAISTMIAACLLAGAVMPLSGQSGAKNGEWRSYGGDLGNTHYSPLDQINAANFYKLQVAWRFKTDNLGPRPEFNFEGTPLMANGVLYSTAGTRRAVVAIDAATGELIWTHGEREGARGTSAPRVLSGRGLSYWTDGREERILYVTPGYRLIALNAKTG